MFRSLVQFTIEKFGKVDYLVNNGGGQFPCGAADMSLKGWNAVIETNLTGTYLMCREVHSQYMGDHGGVIVNIIADMFRGFPMMSHTGSTMCPMSAVMCVTMCRCSQSWC